MEACGTFDYFSVETGLQLEEYDDSDEVCYVLSSTEGIKLSDPPDRFLAYRSMEEALWLYLKPDDWWVVKNKTREQYFCDEKQMMAFEADHRIPVEVVNLVKGFKPNTKVWLRGPPRHKEPLPPIEAVHEEPIAQSVFSADRDYIVEELMRRMNNGRVSARVQVPAPLPEVVLPDPLPPTRSRSSRPHSSTRAVEEEEEEKKKNEDCFSPCSRSRSTTTNCSRNRDSGSFRGGVVSRETSRRRTNTSSEENSEYEHRRVLRLRPDQ